MPVIPLQLGTKFAQHASGPLSHELAENLYLEPAPKGSKFQHTIISVPGLKTFTTVGVGPIRGMRRLGAHLFVVSGEELYAVAVGGLATLVGSVEGTANVLMEDNGVHLWVAADKKLYAANIDGISQVGSDNSSITVGMTGVANQDGFLIATQRGSQNWWISNIDDATTINALDFTPADTFGDIVVGCISDHRELLVFKERSIETYYNSGAAAFPFTRSQVVERGCVASGSIAKDRNRVFWLGDDLQVYSMEGYTPQPISDETVERHIDADPSPQTAEAFTFRFGGHAFYALSLSTTTLIYDINTGLWHKRKSYGENRWKARGHAWMLPWGKNIVGDHKTGAIYELDSDTYDEGGAPLIRTAIGAPVYSKGNRVIVNEFFLDIEPGLGLVTGHGSSPEAILEWTADGGRTWSNGLHRSIGKIGEHLLRARWHHLGAHRQWVPKVVVSDPVPVRINGAYANVEVLAL